MKILKITFATCLGLAISACGAAQLHRAAVQDDSSERLTVGTVQQKIRVGMPASDVAGVLGSPNIVSTDEKRREVWIYDKIATERVFSTSESSILTLILGFGPIGTRTVGQQFGGAISGAAGPYYGESAGAASTTQRTFTVIIKFDGEMKVRDFAYHATRF